MSTEPLDQPTDLTDQRIETIRRALLQWYDQEHRELPWRTEPTEYPTVVAEFMLQQTQVAAVIPFYERFMKRFPTFRKLADASEQDVLRAWSGLGYYRRARMLKRVAEAIVRRPGGKLPRDPKELADLPGFGPYTVGAVGSIALGLVLPVVDGNVRRVVGRLMALPGDLTKGAGKKRLWSVCEALVDPVRPGDFNQGLMELGAMVCHPREPLCLACPLFAECRARALGETAAYPGVPPRPPLKQVREVAVALMREGRVLVLQRGEGGSFAGMWELPRLDSREIFDEENLSAAHVLFDLLRIRAGEGSPIGQTRSTFTHHRIQTELWRVESPDAQSIRRQRHVAHRWLRPSSLARLAASRAQRKLFELVKEKEKDR